MTIGEPPLQWPKWALVYGIVLFATRARRARDAGIFSTLRESSYLLTLLLPAYMFHQFEQHGVDFQRRGYAFQPYLCFALTGTYNESCAANDAFLLAVNVGTVWIALTLGWLSGWPSCRNLGVGAAANSLLLFNAVLHIKSTLEERIYHPGFITAVLLHLPLSVAIFLALLYPTHASAPAATPAPTSAPSQVTPVAPEPKPPPVPAVALTYPQLGAALLLGIAMHVVQIESLIAVTEQRLSHEAAVVIQVLNGFMPLLMIPVSLLGLTKEPAKQE